MKDQQHYEIAEALQSISRKIIYGCGVTDCKNEKPRGQRIDKNRRTTTMTHDMYRWFSTAHGLPYTGILTRWDPSTLELAQSPREGVAL